MSEADNQNILQRTTDSNPAQNGTSATETLTAEIAPPQSDDMSANGAALNGASPDSASLEAKADDENALMDSDVSDEDVAAESEAALEIDQRRAKQLLDRAMLLSERGDLAGAILASRQAVALAPNEPSGHSMLGLLHERAGDLEKAIADYEKVLQLAPNSALERDSLGRLKATLESENSSVLFHFDSNELFEEPESLAPSLPVDVEETPTKASDKAAPVAAPIVATVAAAQSTTDAATASTAGVATNGKQGALQDDKVIASAAQPVAALPPLTMPAMAQQPSLGLLMRKPSFYFKGAPIVAATTLGLLFMAWAGNVSQNKYLDETPAGSLTPTQPTIIEKEPASGGAGAQTGGDGTTVPSPQGVSATNGGGIFGQGNSGATTSVSAPPPPTTRSSGGSASSGSGSGSGGSAAARSSSPSGGQSLPPARVNPVIPQPGGVIGGSSSDSSGGSGTLNTLPAMRPRSAPPEIVRPSAVQGTAPTVSNNSGSNTAGSSNQGGLFNPVAPRGYIRIDPVRPANPVTPAARPSNEARSAENSASRAAAAGRTTEVVPSLTRSIERQPTGYVYQRRAMAFMEQGDYSRAADDFQSAIAAYQDQIRQGQNVEDARNGIQTCRSGLNLALSRRN